MLEVRQLQGVEHLPVFTFTQNIIFIYKTNKLSRYISDLGESMSELSSINCTRKLILTCIRNRSPLLVGLILTNFALFHFMYTTRAANETTGDLTMSKEVDILDVYGGTSKIDMDEMEQRYLVIQRHIDDKLQVIVH